MVADIAKLSVGREEYYTRELATYHELAAKRIALIASGGNASRDQLLDLLK